jgi:hypothetical protein
MNVTYSRTARYFKLACEGRHPFPTSALQYSVRRNASKEQFLIEPSDVQLALSACCLGILATSTRSIVLKNSLFQRCHFLDSLRTAVEKLAIISSAAGLLCVATCFLYINHQIVKLKVIPCFAWRHLHDLNNSPRTIQNFV